MQETLTSFFPVSSLYGCDCDLCRTCCRVDPSCTPSTYLSRSAGGVVEARAFRLGSVGRCCQHLLHQVERNAGWDRGLPLEEGCRGERGKGDPGQELQSWAIGRWAIRCQSDLYEYSDSYPSPRFDERAGKEGNVCGP